MEQYLPKEFTAGSKQFQKGFIPSLPMQGTSSGTQHKLDPAPIEDITVDGVPYKPAGKLDGYGVIITGADNGIGRAIAILFGLSVFVSATIA